MKQPCLLSEVPRVNKLGWLRSTSAVPEKHTQSTKSAACGGFKRDYHFQNRILLLTEGHIPRKMVKPHKTSQLSRIADEESPR